MVSFRMSEEEYEKLWSACEETGARSVSELARTAVGLMIGRAESVERQLESRVRDLEHLVQQLWRRVVEFEKQDPEAGERAGQQAGGGGQGS